MTSIDTTFTELAAEPRVEAVPYSHLSIELGHLYMEDFEAGIDRLRAQFARVAPWARVARTVSAGGDPEQAGGHARRQRVSTCFLIDDYFTRFSTPAEVLPVLLEAARDTNLEIDYLARESACAVADGVQLGQVVAGQLIAVPPQGANGSRPPTLETGWLCNGKRSPGDTRVAMEPTGWTAPQEIGARNHSVFVDVELWHDRDGERLYSCAYLAAVWQLLRLGMLRDEGVSVVRPRQLDDGFPSDWDMMPPITQLRPNAAPFCGYRTVSVLPARFLQTELAVRVVLGQVSPAKEVIDQLVDRASRDGLTVSRDVTERIEYVFFTGS
jgi:hypothetical protein